jgi:twinkle protein
MIIKPEMLSDKFFELRKIPTKSKTLSTGFLDLDEKMRLAKRYLMIVTGYPSCGKSEFVDSLIINQALMHQWSTIYYSPENHPVEEHMAKLAEKFIGKPILEFKEPEMHKALAFLQEHFTWMYPEEPDLDTLLRLAEEEATLRKIDCIVIDPWNSVTHKRGKELIHEYLSEALTKVIRFARTHKVLMAVVAHPKLPTKDKDGNILPPTLYDISDGAMWRNKADYGIVCHREDMSKNEIEIRVQKVKYKWMGKVGNIVLDYNYKNGRFKSKNDDDFYLPTDIQAPF